MKSKQEVIQEAWGQYWDQVKDHVDKNGKLKYFHCWQIFGDGIKSDRNFYDHELQDKSLNLQNCEWDMAYYPKSLQGIETNNGWTRIESEDDLPNKTGEYHIINRWGNRSRYIVRCIKTLVDDWKRDKFTHWHPVIEPEDPIY